MVAGMNDPSTAVPILRGAALVSLLLGIVLLLDSWDGLYNTLDLPQSLPALTTQLGGAALLGLGYLLWAAAPRPEVAPVAAVTGLIAQGGGALVIAGWLIFRDPSDDLGIDTPGTVILIVAAVILALLAIALARVALANRSSAD
jgi:hypothetical protein